MVSDLLSGISKYFEAAAILRTPGFRRYILYSGVIGLSLFALLIFLVLLFYASISSFFQSLLPFNYEFISHISDFLSVVIMSVLFLLIFKYLVLIFTAPVMSVLSEKVERRMAGDVSAGETSINFLKDILRGLRINLRNIVREMGLTIVLIVLGLIPLFAVFVTPLLFLVQSYYAGYGNYDFWAERHFTYANTLRFMKDHRPMVTGNGIVFMILLAIPILGVFIAPPLATVAATIHGNQKLRQYDNRN